MNHYGADYLAARFSVWDLGRSRLSRLGELRPIADYRAWQESRRARRDARRDSGRLDAHLRADIGLVPDGIYPPVEDFAPGPAEVTDMGVIAANDNLAANDYLAAKAA